jgi:hypothetical protein
LKGTAVKGIVPFFTVPIIGLCIMAMPTGGSAETLNVDTKVNVCADIKQLVDNVATAILNDSSDEAFDELVKNVLGEFCTLRKSVSSRPALLPMADELTTAVLGWAWDVSSLLKFKAQRNDIAADIAANSMRRQVTKIQTLCPAIVVPNLARIP